MSFTD
jgi:hypothetical protein